MATLARLFLVYMLIPSFGAVCALIMDDVRLILFFYMSLIVAFWFALHSKKTPERSGQLDPFLACCLLSAGATFTVTIRSLTMSADGMPSMLFEAGFLFLEFILVSEFVECRKRQVPKIGRAGMAAILYGWSNLCAVPIVSALEVREVQIPALSSCRLIPVGASVTYFMMGIVFLSVCFLAPRTDKRV